MDSSTEELSAREESKIQHSELISLLYSHFCAISQAGLTSNNYGCTIGHTTEQLVSIIETLAEFYLHVVHLTIIIEVYEALA